VTQYWFKPKRYGYGATPATWQGWAVTLGTVLAMVGVNAGLPSTGQHSWTLAAVLGFDALALAFLFIVCRRKTEGELRWRWGDR
jgi:LPXTG-motif cell wall-anchored protein